MTRRIVLCLSHSIEEHDQLRLLSEIGHEVASIGGYIDPAHPHDPKRPALDVPMVPAIKEAVDAIGSDDNLGAAQALLPDAVLDWADTIIYHHYLDRLYGQWSRIKDWLNGDSNRRVIWRTVGQSVDGNEATAVGQGAYPTNFRAEGLEIVRYSPKERNIPHYAGEDVLIRFYKDPDEWCGWRGDGQTATFVREHPDPPIPEAALEFVAGPFVANVTQHLFPRSLDDYGRVAPQGKQYTSWSFWEEATKGLPRLPAGPGSEAIGGVGELSFDAMQEYLRAGRVYLYTGTQPASYTLGLIEAMMTGIPVVSIGPSWMQIFPYGSELFEGHEIVGNKNDNPKDARGRIRRYLDDFQFARSHGGMQRGHAIELFGIDTIREQWRRYLA